MEARARRTPRRLRSIASIALLLLLLAPAAGAEIVLPPGFSAQVYVSGEGFDLTSRGGRGIPSSSTLVFDEAGVLYLARTGRRYTGGEIEDIYPIYRIPPGGARITPATERSFLYGPPLPNPQVAGLRRGREVLVTTYDRDRRIGVVLIAWAVYSIATGLTSPLIDNGAHIGGAIGGALIARHLHPVVLAPMPPAHAAWVRRWLWVAGALVVYTFAGWLA